MSKLSSIKDNHINPKNSCHLDSSSEQKTGKFFYFSDQKINSSANSDANDEDKLISNSALKCGGNSYTFKGNNELFTSFINSKNNKNKELSLLYLINTFNKSYSSESTEKNKIIIDLPKISKNLFSFSHIRHKSSNNLDCQTFQNNLYLSKYGGDIVNNFISSLYEKQYCDGNVPNHTISPKKGRKNKCFFINSGNKINTFVISPFTNGNPKFEKLNGNNFSSLQLNIDAKERKELNENPVIDKCFNSSLLMNTLSSDEYNKK